MNQAYDTEYTYFIQAPTVDPEDVDQEAELLRLQGVSNPNKSLIRKKLAIYDTALFSGEVPFAKPMPGTEPGPTVASPEVIEQLLDWATQQSETITQAVLEFLEDPTEDQLNFVLKMLSPKAKAAQKTQAPVLTFSSMLLNFIRSRGTVTIEELYDYARAVHTAKRPEATVRQLLRRWVNEGTVLSFIDSQIKTYKAS